MRDCHFLLASLIAASALLHPAAAAEAMQNNKVNLTVVRYGDHLQVQCNPMSLETAMRSDWKTICNEMAAAQVQKLVTAGTIAAIKGPVFDTAAADPAAGPMLSRNIALAKSKP